MGVIQDAAASARERVGDLGKDIRHLQEDVVEGATDVLSDLRREIRRHPYQAVAIAAAAGFIIGLLSSRR